ncbi:hypothetical protein SFRURICE_012544 [Spodoptera frugiperda]|nr:hypothetical protein SFRURICE_012544 [Spodoptera frugiperda]
MCYATLLWLRSASTNHIHWCKYSALVETDGRIKTHSLARRKKEVWIRMHVLSIYRKHELRIFLVQLHSIVSVETVPWNSGAFFVPRIKNDFIITQKLAPLSELAIVVL